MLRYEIMKTELLNLFEKLEDHPDVKGHMPSIACRKDFGIDNEPDVIEMKVKKKKEADMENINQGMHIQYNDDQRQPIADKIIRRISRKFKPNHL